MKHYSREHERSRAQIAALEQRKNTCEAGMMAITACWEQVGSSVQHFIACQLTCLTACRGHSNSSATWRLAACNRRECWFVPHFEFLNSGNLVRRSCSNLSRVIQPHGARIKWPGARIEKCSRVQYAVYSEAYNKLHANGRSPRTKDFPWPSFQAMPNSSKWGTIFLDFCWLCFLTSYSV